MYGRIQPDNIARHPGLVQDRREQHGASSSGCSLNLLRIYHPVHSSEATAAEGLSTLPPLACVSEAAAERFHIATCKHSQFRAHAGSDRCTCLFSNQHIDKRPIDPNR
eukprot:scaffold99763_cov34-Prasinocladus_malaysianus.AAC.1